MRRDGDQEAVSGVVWMEVRRAISVLQAAGKEFMALGLIRNRVLYVSGCFGWQEIVNPTHSGLHS